MPEASSERFVNSPTDRIDGTYGRSMALSGFSGSSVLVVDDEPMVREVVSSYLVRDGFSVSEAADGDKALAVFQAHRPDLVVLDVMLPGIDGYSLIGMIRAIAEVPVILLTARTEEADRVLGLELGADDYVVKPFSPRELAARVRAVLKRSRQGVPEQGGVVEAGDFRIDLGTREVRCANRLVSLKPREFDLLAFLARNPRQVFSRGQLLEQVWDSNASWQDPSTVTVHVRRIRQSIEPYPDRPRYLTTVWGVGYRFEP